MKGLVKMIMRERKGGVDKDWDEKMVQHFKENKNGF